MNFPQHVVIIPDGNRRWARERGLKPWEGHIEGAKNTEAIIESAKNLGVRCLSFWGSSQDNLVKRPVAEKKALLDIYFKNFTRLIEGEEIHRDRVRVSIIGRWKEQFPSALTNLLCRAEEVTREYDAYFLNFFLAYNGDDEMLDAVRTVARSGVSPELITPEMIKEALWTRDLPLVDYLIRTGGEPHLSAGFMMWDIANAELFFSDKNYPDFGPDEFEKAIVEYGERGRRKGA